MLTSDLISKVRRSLRDWPKIRIDTGTGDGVTTVFDLGKDIAVQSGSDVVLVAAALKVRGVDYVIDYDANQITFTVAPALGAAIKITYKEQVWREELVIDGLNAGRRALF